MKGNHLWLGACSVELRHRAINFAGLNRYLSNDLGAISCFGMLEAQGKIEQVAKAIG